MRFVTCTTPTPLEAAIAAALEQRRTVGGDLIATSSALVTIRNPDGAYFVFRLRVRGNGRAAGPASAPLGYWVDVSRGGAVWEACGTTRHDGRLLKTSRSTSEEVALFACEVALRAVADRRRVVEREGRTYTVLVEDR